MLRWTLHLNNGVGTPKDSVKVAVGHKVYSFGVHENNKIDVRIFNTVTMRWTPLALAKAGNECNELQEITCWKCTPVLIENVIYHVWWETDKSVIYTFNVDTHTWFRPSISGVGPDPGKSFDRAVCAVRDSIFICRESECYSVNIYKLSTTKMTWTLIEARGLPVRQLTARPATAIGTKIFIFRSFHEIRDYMNIKLRGYLWMFDTETECWLSMPELCPEGCSPIGCQAFAHSGQLYIFDGYSFCYQNYFSKDMWRFNPDTFSWKKLEPKGIVPRSSYKSIHRICCALGDLVVLFCDEEDANDLFVLDLNPSLKTLCKLAVIHYALNRAELTHNIRWELDTMTTNMCEDEDHMDDEGIYDHFPLGASGKNADALELSLQWWQNSAIF